MKPEIEGNTIFSRQRIAAMDKAFRSAMIAAIRAGHERPPSIGVYKDPRPASPRHYERYGHPRSYAGSTAAMCAEVAGYTRTMDYA